MMKNLLFLYVFTFAYLSAFAQIEKIFVDNEFAYRIDRTQYRWLTFSVNGLKNQDTLNTFIEVINTGRYDYHPVAWHMIDSFLYAVEMRRLDDLFVSVFLIRYTISLGPKESERFDLDKTKKSMKTLYYLQILDKYLFEISERKAKVEQPMYFDFVIDGQGMITIAILEKDKNKISVFEKSIMQHEKEDSENIPIYKRIETWKTIDTFSSSLQTPFRILKENNRLYVVDEDGTLFESKGKKLEKYLAKNLGPIAILFDKESQKNFKFISLENLKKIENINKSNIKKYFKKLIDK